MAGKLLLKQFRSLDENHFETKVRKFSVSEVDQSPSQVKSVKDGLQGKNIFINNVFSEPGVWKKGEQWWNTKIPFVKQDKCKIFLVTEQVLEHEILLFHRWVNKTYWFPADGSWCSLSWQIIKLLSLLSFFLHTLNNWETAKLPLCSLKQFERNKTNFISLHVFKIFLAQGATSPALALLFSDAMSSFPPVLFIHYSMH